MKARTNTRRNVIRSIIALFVAVALAGGIIVFGQIQKAMTSDDRPANAAQVTLREGDTFDRAKTKDGVTFTEHFEVYAKGKTGQIAPPTPTIAVDHTTVASLCTAAIVVNNYSADDPTDDTKEARSTCKTAEAAYTTGDSATCIDRLSYLAAVNLNSEELKQSFTIGGLYNACGDTAGYADAFADDTWSEPIYEVSTK